MCEKKDPSWVPIHHPYKSWAGQHTSLVLKEEGLITRAYFWSTNLGETNTSLMRDVISKTKGQRDELVDRKHILLFQGTPAFVFQHACQVTHTSCNSRSSHLSPSTGLCGHQACIWHVCVHTHTQALRHLKGGVESDKDFWHLQM